MLASGVDPPEAQEEELFSSESRAQSQATTAISVGCLSRRVVACSGFFQEGEAVGDTFPAHARGQNDVRGRVAVLSSPGCPRLHQIGMDG